MECLCGKWRTHNICVVGDLSSRVAARKDRAKHQQNGNSDCAVAIAELIAQMKLFLHLA
jgi:hypothetical protein